MSIKQILENVKYFVATILRNAYFDNDWDRDAIKNAMNWAEYCEKLYAQAKGKAVEEQFNTYLKALASEPASIVPNANFEFLKDSTKALNMALLQNPYLSRDLMGIVIQKYQADDKFKDELLRLIQLKSSFLILEEWSKFRRNEHSEYSLNQTITAELAVATLRNRFLESEDISKREAVINSFFSQMTKSSELMVPLVHIWCMPSSSGSDILLMQTMLMQLLLPKITIEEPEYNPRISGIIWNLKPEMLSKLSLLYSSFCKKYCNYLVACGQQLQICYTTTGVKWKPREDREGAVSYNDLVHHFVSLGVASDKIQRHIVKTLHSLASSSVYSVWEDILNETNQCLSLKL